MSPVRNPGSVASLRRGLGKPGPELPATPAVPAVTVPPRPEKPVRITLDLTPAAHRALRDFAADTGAGVSAAAALRAMIAVTIADQGIAAEVREKMRQARQ